MSFRFFLGTIAMLVSCPALAQSAPDLVDLVGARAAGGETQMEARGYRLVESSTVRDMKFTFWRNDRRNACVSVSTVEGRYASIQQVPWANCDEGGMAAPAQSAGEAGTDSLVLVCYGAGNKPTVTSTPTYTWNRDRHKWDWGSTVSSSTQAFSSDVQLEIYGDHARIHLGQSLVPPIHSGGSNGWWEVDNLAVTPTQITGSYRLNGMNKPKFTVDRRTGRIEIRAVTNFAGQCDAGNWGAGTRRF